jgi:hypothetical protein
MDERRRVFERLQQLQGNIRVICRVRPSLKSEMTSDSCVAIGSDAFDAQPAAAAAAAPTASVVSVS